MKIGWIGLGNMGIPMVSNLIRAGFEVALYNRTRAKAEQLLALGASFVDKPADLYKTSDVVITMVSDDAAVKEIYTGPDSFLAGATAGKIAIDMSTVSPQTSQFLANQCSEKGVSFMDAPVSGSVKPATDGTLIIMAGGDTDTFEKVKGIFAVLGKMALHLGGNGSGSNAKLAINLLLGITVQGLAETVLFANQRGIKTEDMLNIITESAVGTPIARMKLPNILANEFPAAFALKHMAKDLRLAQEAGAAFPLAETVNGAYQSALQDGYGDQDVMAILGFLAGKR
ncbi:NAD(P)-dependent oxidoreductase [Brevibacillus sp. SYSU BS000544]|uniref:NAD(P)-dependent oxidoreductase n=1 Tax=Brevibacillus sp. SYSU BS000544 TaxID=3416443 RepID=UPI003CE47A1F